VERSPEIWIVAAKRTPFGAFGGALRDFKATDLATLASQAALSQAGVAPDAIDQVIFGNVVQTTPEDVYNARHVGLRAGVPVERPALTVNRLCGSGFQAVISAALEIRGEQARVVLCGGTESMSQAPHAIRGLRWGVPFGKAPPTEDLLWTALTDTYAGCAMGITAENLAAQYNVTRQACDDYALSSQRRWAAADEAGFFTDEIVPVEVKKGKGPAVSFARDEHPRPATTPESLAKLAPVFKSDGVVTAGNASGIADGAAALIVAERSAAEALKLAPLARVVSWGVAGVDPKIMGIGPVPAIRIALERSGLALSDMALIEVNEAFAPQYLAVEAEARLPREKTNVDGGAIALGHPLGASGSRILTHLIYALRRTRGRYAVGSACVGGGQGIAVVLESLV
jgi:acetyl-CoA acyltransferase 2